MSETSTMAAADWRMAVETMADDDEWLIADLVDGFDAVFELDDSLCRIADRLVAALGVLTE